MTSVAAWIQALPPDGIAQVCRAYEHAEDEGNNRGAPFEVVMAQGAVERLRAALGAATEK